MLRITLMGLAFIWLTGFTQKPIELNFPIQNNELISEVEVKHLGTQEIYQFGALGWHNDCSEKPSPLKPNSDDINLADIINVGEMVWELIRDNGPVLEAKNKRASAIPRGVGCWTDLSNWEPVRAENYEVIYRNLYGFDVIKLAYQVIYSWGGRLGDSGRYLTNATIRYKDVQVMWGYLFNATVEIPAVTNIGTRENPIAAMEMILNWSVDTRPLSLKKSLSSTSFFVVGDGRPTRVID